MSSLNVSSVLSTISALEAQLAALRAQLGGVGSGPAKPVAEKKPRKKSDAPPSAWRLFADRVRGLLTANGYSGKALGTECVQFCSSLKTENADFASWTDSDILARRADWSAPAVSKQAEAGLHWKNGKKVVTPSGSAAVSVVSDGDGDGGAAPAEDKPAKTRKNPWAGLSPEDKAAKVAAMKAGRAAKKAASSAESAPTDTEDAAPAPVADAVSDGGSSAKKARKPWSAETKAAAAAKRAAKKTATAATSSSTVVAPPPLPASPTVEPEPEFQGMMLGGVRYLVNLGTGHCYKRATDGSQGDWAGIFHRTGGPKNGPYIDDAVPEPAFTDLDELD